MYVYMYVFRLEVWAERLSRHRRWWLKILKDFLAAVAETQTILSRRRRRCLKQLIKISAAAAAM